MKIQKITLKNFRGARAPVSLAMNGQSLLLYGDNGTGKSSFADAVEWFVTDNVDHLNGEEVRTNGGLLTALRNALCNDDEECSVELSLTPNQTGQKVLISHKEKLKAQLDTAGEKIVSALEKERVLIRNRELVKFIVDRTKTERLADISEIIGFQDIASTKEILKKATNTARLLLKNRDFERLISNKKETLVKKLQQTVNSKEQFYKALNAKFKTFKVAIEVVDEVSLNEAYAILKNSVNQEELKLRNVLEAVVKGISEAINKLPDHEQQFDGLVKALVDLQKDKSLSTQISISRLLEEAERTLALHDKDECPVCLKPERREVLIDLIKSRLDGLRQIQQKAQSISAVKNTALGNLREQYGLLNTQLVALKSLSNEVLQADIFTCSSVIDAMKSIGEELNKEPFAIDISQLSRLDIRGCFTPLETKVSILLETKKADDADQRISFLADIQVCQTAFEDIQRFEKERSVIEVQRTTLEKIYSQYTELQRKEMEEFLKNISAHVNEYFLYMNKDKEIDSIELSAVSDADGEFSGVAVQAKFHGQMIPSPKIFLSESYVNCIGLCIFLAAVRLFNKQAKFFILDDVISSFDSTHRLRFGQLLAEKFSDYQIIVFTHESSWFDIMQNLVKGTGWKISKTQWNAKDGISLEEPSGDLKEQIDKKIKANSVEGLGNLMRKYAERVLKELCLRLEVEVKFQFNDRNEGRMPDELLTCIRTRLKDKSDLADNAAAKKLAGSKFITNRSSHDSSYEPTIDDLKAFFADLNDFVDLFTCTFTCKQRVSGDNENKAKKTISCRCGAKEIMWKA